MKNKFVYVILHYKNIFDTIECIKSIKKINNNNKIVVVDNGTLNKKDEKKLEKLVSNLIKLPENLGFAKANNIGAKLAIQKYKPEFLVVLNNDIVINQLDFEKNILKIHDNDNFHALGPKILTNGCDSVNPFYTYDTVEEIKKQIKNAKLFIKIYESSLLYMLYKLYSSLKRKLKKKVEFKNGLEEKKGVSLHGCAIIFSRKYYEKYEDIFYDETFLFHEEEFLSYRKNKDNLLFMYSPNIEVFHKEGASVSTVYKDDRNKLIFKNNERIKSMELLLKKYEKKEEEK